MASRYLVSFCNNDERLRLAIVTPQGIERVVDLGSNLLPLPALGLTGICVDGERIFVALQAYEPAILLMLDREYELRAEIRVENAADLHGVLAIGSELMIVSTGTSQLLSVDRADPGESRVVWTEGDAGHDRDHLNDLHLTPDRRLLLSRFGQQQPGRMRSGAIVEVRTGTILLDGLREPHSPYWWDSQVYVLESATGDLIRARPGGAPERVAGIVGYARGLALDEHYIAIGKSGYREISRGRLGDDRSAPLVPEGADSSLLRCSGVYFIAQDGGAVSWVDTTSCGTEIYQILPLIE